MLCNSYQGDIDSARANLEPRLRLLPPSTRLTIIKTLANSWSTSSRFQEGGDHLCVFGCSACCPRSPLNDCRDSLTHYLVCPIFWSLLEEVSPVPMPRSCSEKLGIVESWFDLRIHAVAHHVYHYVRFSLGKQASVIHTYKQWGEWRSECVIAARVAFDVHF